MPEGDNIFRTAHVLQRAIGGQKVTGYRSSLPSLIDADLVGHTISTVEACGKNLLISFDDGRVLYSHMRMSGSWHIYRPGEAWQRSERQSRVVLETSNYIAVCFNAPVVELLSAQQVKRHSTLQRLGPDLLKDDFSYEEAMRRLREHNNIAISEAIMRQSIMAGIGNVYKSEILFILHINPWTLVGQLSDPQIRDIVATARELMRKNLEGKPRTTRWALDRQRHWVYKRSGRPCHRCGTLIRMRRQGDDGRSTYWCPQCQSGVTG